MSSSDDVSTPENASHHEATPKQYAPDLDPESESLKNTLSQLSEELINVDISKFESKDKITILEKHHLLMPEFKHNLEQWPEALKIYFY